MYLLFALVVRPTYVPLAVRSLEPHGARGKLITAFDGLGAVVSALFSRYRHTAIFGVVNLIAVAVIARLAIDGFASLWCGWAALTSIAIAAHIRFGGRSRIVAQAPA